MTPKESEEVIWEFENLLITDLENKRHLAVIYLTLAEAYQCAEEYAMFDEAISKSLEIFFELNDHEGIAHCLIEKAVNIKVVEGKEDDLAILRDAMKYIPSDRIDISVRAHLKIAQRKASRKVEMCGRTEIKAAQSMAKNVDDPRCQLQTQLISVEFDRIAGNMTTPDVLIQIISKAKEIGWKEGQFRALVKLSQLFVKLDDTLNTIAVCQQVIHEAKIHNFKIAKVVSNFTISQAYAKLKSEEELEKAIFHAEKAYKIVLQLHGNENHSWVKKAKSNIEKIAAIKLELV